MQKNHETLDQQRIEQHLNTTAIGQEIHILSDTTSTNDWAAEMSGKCQNGSVFLAEHQTNGRGRRGRVWDSAPNEGLFMSLLLYPTPESEKVAQLTLCAGLAVCKAICDITGLTPKIKWPNDIVLNKKKLCGILAEMKAESDRIIHVIIGIGVNVNQTKFPEELEEIATSLFLATGKNWDRNALAAAICNRFEELQMEQHRFPMEEYRSQCITIGRDVEIISVSERFRATALDVMENGALTVKKEDGTVKQISAGEVSVRGIFGYSD